MAKKEKQLSEKDKKRLEKDKKEQLVRQKEKEKKKKARLEKLKKREAKENKKIKSIVSFPFKALFQVSVILAILALVIQYFGQGKDLAKALLGSFMVLTAVYLGVGLIMLAVIFIISENKKKEMEDQKKQQEEMKKAEELKRREELSKIEEDMRIGELRRQEELRRFRETNMNNAKAAQPGFQDLSDQADLYMDENQPF